MYIRLNINLFLLLAIIFLLPSLTFVLLRQSSLATGMLVVFFILFFLFIKIFLLERIKVSTMLIFLSVELFLFFSSIFNLLEFNTTKPLYSFMTITLMFIVASLLARFIVNLRIKSSINSVFIFILLLLLFGYIKLIYMPEFLGYMMGTKATFPFSEESHYALTLGIISIASSFVNNNKKNIFIILNMLLLSIIFPSLTLMAFSILMIIVIILRSRIKYLKLILLILLPLFLFGLNELFSQMTYFSSRLNLENNTNITSLVWLQGWQLAYLNFFHTNGLGLGFQMLGQDNTIYGNITEIISSFMLDGALLNTQDGGFLAAKLIAEFGVIGLIITCSYILFLMKIVHMLQALYQKKYTTEIEQKQLLMYGFIFGFIIEMFLRGIGYFSPNVFMLLTALFSLHYISQSKEQL